MGIFLFCVNKSQINTFKPEQPEQIAANTNTKVIAAKITTTAMAVKNQQQPKNPT